MKRAVYYLVAVFSLSLIIYLLPPSTWIEEGEEVRQVGGGDTSLPFNFPRPTETQRDQLSFHYYDNAGKLYDGRSEEGERALTSHELSLLTQAKNTASPALPGTVFHGGRYRWLPDGVEHDLLYEVKRSNLLQRVTLFQKLDQPKIVRIFDAEPSKTIHIILSLKGRLDKYKTFLDHLATTVLPYDQNLRLILVCFSPSDVETTRNATSTLLANFPNFQSLVLPLGDGQEEHFSRGRGLHQGALRGTKEEDDLIFFCDVDVLMSVDFFTRCRANTVFQRQVYYPMVFSLYNPQLVYPLQDQTIPPVPQQLKVGEELGFFRQFGYGMACVTRGDYLATGGYLDLPVWGGEDEALYQSFLARTDIKVIRAPEPSLFHLYHGKVCTETGDASYVSCIKSKAKTEGSKLQLGMTLLKLQQGTDLEGLLSKRFYYFWLVPYLGGLLLLSLLTNLLLATLLLTWARKNQQGYKVL